MCGLPALSIGTKIFPVSALFNPVLVCRTRTGTITLALLSSKLELYYRTIKKFYQVATGTNIGTGNGHN